MDRSGEAANTTPEHSKVGKAYVPVSESSMREMAVQGMQAAGYMMSDDEYLKKMVGLTRDKMFPKMKFVQSAEGLERLGRKLQAHMGIPDVLTRHANSQWNRVWRERGAKFCRKAISAKRSEVTHRLRLQFFGEQRSNGTGKW